MRGRSFRQDERFEGLLDDVPRSLSLALFLNQSKLVTLDLVDPKICSHPRQVAKENPSHSL